MKKKSLLCHSFRSPFVSHSSFFLDENLGFTLVELLVVIAVIGILALGAISYLNPLQKILQAQDAGRIASVKQIQSALARYYVSYGYYPLSQQLAGYPISHTDAQFYWSVSGNDPNFLIELKNSGDLRSIPQDPVNNCTGGGTLAFGKNDNCYSIGYYASNDCGISATAGNKGANGYILAVYLPSSKQIYTPTVHYACSGCLPSPPGCPFESGTPGWLVTDETRPSLF